MRANWLADITRQAIEPEGYRVFEVADWWLRGNSAFDPHWQIFHHTASAVSGGNNPALGICINGRSDLPGPLCNRLWARNGDCYIVASGRANHAGTGTYPDGTSGNSRSFGDEVENNGVGEPWSERLLRAVELGQEAVAQQMGWGPERTIGHKEYTSRKIDPFSIDMNEWRARLAQMEDDDMFSDNDRSMLSRLHDRIGSFDWVHSELFGPPSMRQLFAQLLDKPVADVDEQVLANALAPLLQANLSNISDTDLQKIAKAVADEDHRRLES